MHILLALLGTVVTLLVLLHRLAEIGVDLGGFNPFLRRRRRAWRQKYEANPIFALEDPLDIAAVLVVGVARVDGDMTSDEKAAVLREFENTLGLEPDGAAQLARSASHLIGDGNVLDTQLDDVLRGRQETFSDNQVESLLEMMQRVANEGNGETASQRRLMDNVRRLLTAPKPASDW